MSKNTYIKKEVELDKVWSENLDRTISDAGKEERALAIQEGDVDEDGIPFTTVIVDGGWAKRSYGHKYNSLSGVAVIIGQRTGKLLFLGVKNKYCTICRLHSGADKEPKKHFCYKNWSQQKPSTAMEQSVIVEGFCNSIQMHGLKYKYFVGDGDSSVYARIIQNVPYGRFVHKLECANHCIRNYTSHLHTLASDKSFDPEARRMLKSVIPRLTSAARGAIRHCGKVGEKAEDLIKDLRNGPNHVFGDHSECRPYFCEGNESDGKRVNILLGSVLFDHIQGLLGSLVAKAPRLVENKTSNAAEFYMSLVAKFNAGKRLNFTQRGSFQRRCHAAALRFQKGHAWEISPFRKLAGRSPGLSHYKVIRKRQQTLTRRKLQFPDDFPKKKRSKTDTTHPADIDYGPSSEQVEDDPCDEISDAQLAEKCENFVESLNVTSEQQEEIAIQTKDQADCISWHELRRVRLTASNFGTVCRRKESTPCANLVKNLLYKPSVNTKATEYGRRNEHVAIKRFEALTGLDVEKRGLYIDVENGFLGASPDGIVVTENATIEVKCVPSGISTGLQELARGKKGFFLQEIASKKLQLKTTHHHFYQIQGTLNITKKDFCYLIVMTDTKQDLFVEKVQRNEDFWRNEMLPKLTRFYKKCLLPEIVDSRVIRGKPVREPEYISKAKEEMNAKKSKKS
ncbi:uncharacterized protein LOC134540920 [Bacillus rossius redtenbacheri]|uniref:uncharacterized protein LOC134540920 n=1 Tax=Bacillus rossius redtenbacheri TaxID=93214 RepID=UPI002FDEE26F